MIINFKRKEWIFEKKKLWIKEIFIWKVFLKKYWEFVKKFSVKNETPDTVPAPTPWNSVTPSCRGPPSPHWRGGKGAGVLAPSGGTLGRGT